MDGNTVKKFVRERYAGIARQGTSCCGPEASCGCGGEPETGQPENRLFIRGDRGGSPWGRSRPRMRQPGRACFPAEGRGCPGSGIRRGVRLFPRGPRGRPGGESDRRGHDAGHDREGQGERRKRGISKRRVPARGDRESSGGRPFRGRRPLQLRHQSLPGQREGLFGSVSDPQAGRAGDDLGHRSYPGTSGGGRRIRGGVCRMRRGGYPERGIPPSHGGGRVPGRPGHAGEPVRYCGGRGGRLHNEHDHVWSEAFRAKRRMLRAPKREGVPVLRRGIAVKGRHPQRRFVRGRAGGDAGRAGSPRPFADNGS